jgi:hypothetical protein
MRRGILATRDELRQLRERINQKPFDKIYEFLRRRCALILQSAPIREPQWRGLAQQGCYSPALLAARTTQGRLLDLLVAHHVDANPAYRDRAIEELKGLVSWSTWTDPTLRSGLADLCTAEAATAAAIGLDWLYEDLGEPDRLRVLHALRHKAIDPYNKAVASGAWWYSCYHSWNAVINSGIGLAALALSDEEPPAQEAYHKAMGGLRNFFAALGREGGWDEGTGYWGYAMRYVLLLGEAAGRLVEDRSIYHMRGMDSTGLYPVYFSPNGQAASFGDNPGVPLLGAIYLLVRHYGQKELTWWLDTYAFHRDVSAADWSAAGLALLMRPTDADVPASPDLRPLKVFNEIGWAAMADAWPRPGLYAAIKAGDLSANHSQHDMNSIQVQVGGEMLLTDLGHAPYTAEYFTDARSRFYEVQTRAHNTVTIGGSDHRLDAQGTIVEAQTGKNYRWVAANAGTALGETVHYVRHLVMITHAATQQGKLLVVLDELLNPTGQPVDLYWHSSGSIVFDPSSLTGTIGGQQSELHLAMATNAAGVAAKLSEHPLGPGRADRCLHLTLRSANKLMIASVFSPHPIAGKVDLKKIAGGEWKVRIGSSDLLFKGLRKHLQLEEVNA